MASFFASTILLLLLHTAVSVYNPEICKVFKDSSGLIPPPLPTNFEVKGESVNNLGKSSAYLELYFDYIGSRGKYMFVHKGIEHHFLFDYNTYQIVMWDLLHPGQGMQKDPLSQTCVAENMEDSEHSRLFGYQESGGNKAKMYNSNQVFRYGGQFVVAANGTDSLQDRGISVNNFVSCLYDSSVDSTIMASFSFTGQTMEPSGGTEYKDIVGPEEGYLSVPARVQWVGEARHLNGTVEPTDNTLSISWFKGDPEFKAGTFQIPPFVYCKDYRGKKEMPKLPTAFSTRLIITQYMVDNFGEIQLVDSEGYNEIYYYGEKRLAREDFTIIPAVDTELFEKLQSASRISIIDDFNSGLRYAMSKATGRCFISSIPDNSLFDTHEPLIYRKMGTPEEVFLMQTDEMEYKGKAFARDIESDVWTGKYDDKILNAEYVKETYFSTNGWHEISDEAATYGVPVKHLIIRNTLDGVAMQGVGAYNFLKFKPKPPKLAVFSIRSCIEQITHKTYAIRLSVPDDVRDTIFKYRYNFVETAQYYLSDISQVLSPLRVQRVHLRRQSMNNDTPFLVFALLDKVNFSKSSVIIPQKGADLQEASNNIQRHVDGSRFNIEFYPPGSKDAVIITVKAGDMYLIKPGGELNFAPMESLDTEDSKVQEEVLKVEASEDEGKEEEDVEEIKGMSPGSLTLLAFGMLFIGVGIGIAIMYLYIRMYSDRRIEEKIDMQNRSL